MSFVQLIRFTTHDIAAVRRINEEWRAATDGARTLQSQCLYVDHADPSRYVVAAEFESAEAAAANSALPQTQRAAAQIAAVVSELTYTDLDLLETDTGAAVAS